MNQDASQNDKASNRPHGLDDQWAELLSAYHDGELSAAEQAEVEQRLANDPAAQRWLTEIGALGTLCQQAAGTADWQDVSADVLAEAARRKDAGTPVEDRPLVASQIESQETTRNLEPAGDFGLPFGRSSRGWAWAGVAAAAAIMIGYWDQPAQQANQSSVAYSHTAPQHTGVTSVSRDLAQMRRTVPGLRVVRLELTPQGRKQFEQLLARTGFGMPSGSSATLPQELAAARQAGLMVESVDSMESNNSQMMFVSAEAPRYSELVKELEKDSNTYRVEADPAPEIQASGKIPLPIKTVSPQMSVRIAPAEGRRLLIRIRITKAPAQIGAAPSVAIVKVKPSHEGSTTPADAVATAPVRIPEQRLPVLFVIKNRVPTETPSR